MTKKSTKKIGTNIFDLYGTSRNLEKNGSKFYIDRDTDSYLLIARRERNYDVERELAKVHVQFEGCDSYDAAYNEAIYCALVKGLVKGWNNLYDENGDLIEYSSETAVDLFVNKLPDLLMVINEFSLNKDNYKLSLEKAAKN